jgi:hypothetical protein
MGKWTPKAKPDILFSRVETAGGMKYVFNARLTFYPLLQERKQLLAGFGFADDRPENPVARIFRKTTNNSPRKALGREPFSPGTGRKDAPLFFFCG